MTSVDDADDAMTNIPDFFAGRSVFITGVTGFLGKILLERLLFSCPRIKNIYVLIRPKKKQDACARLEDVLNSKLFEKVEQQVPAYRQKVVAMQGDILDAELGLSEADLITLRQNVSVIFHSAATVKFDEPLRLAIRMNVLGVRQLLHVARQMTSLVALVHVSTAYANCDRKTISEEVYTPPVHPSKVISAAEWMSDEALDAVTSRLVAPRPNTYTYTKALAETLLLEERGTLPCCIVRPSIIGSSWKHPFPGWVDNFNGPSGLFVAIGKGMLRVMIGESTNVADIIPADICVDLMIAAAWSTAIDKPDNVPVYNCTSGNINKLHWGDICAASYYVYVDVPFDNPVRIPDPKFTTSRIYKFFHKYLDHYLPAWVFDTGAWLGGKRRRLVKLQRRMWRSVETLEFFTSNEWNFTGGNVAVLKDKLSLEDKKEFSLDVSEVDWKIYLEDYCLGVKYFAMKESSDMVAKARNQMTRLFWVRRAVNVVMVIASWRFLMSRFQTVRQLWRLLIMMLMKLNQRVTAALSAYSTVTL